METAGSKDLEDSLFSPDSHLDWADEVMAEDMNDFSLPKYDDGVSAFSTSPKPIQSNGMYHERKDSGRDPRGNKPSSNHSYQTQNQQQQQSGRQSRGSGEYRGRNGQRTAGRTRGGGGRSSSRAGYSSTQQPYTQQPGGAVLQVGSLRTRRGSSDRSVSMERSGSTERGVRGWRSTATAYGRARADLPDRWEHDKFDPSQTNPPAPPSVHSRYPGSSGGSSSNNNGRGRERRNSSSSSAAHNEFSGSGPVDIEHIGKEGISHVTINRRESNASSRGFGMATSYESPRRLGSLDSAPDDVAGSFRSKPTQPVQQATAFRPKSPSLPSTAALAAPSSGHHPYRAPHKRAGSIDSPEDHTSSGSFPHDTTATIAAAAASVVGTSRSVENSSKGFTRSPVDGDGPSAELEWENFVANGGLEMPFENITDDLLKHPQRQPAGRKQSGSGSKNGHRQKPADKNGNSSSSSSSNAGVAGGDKAAQYASRTMLLLSNDEDQENDDASDSPDRSGPGSREADRPTRGGSGGSSKPSGGGGGGTARKEISIRGTAKPTGASGMASLLGDHASASRPRRPSIPAKKTREPVDPAVGIRIKGTFPDTSSSSASASSSTPGAANGSGSTRTHPAEPSMPSRTTTASPTLRAPTPTKPASPSPSISRSSSTEGRRPAATVPSSYLRRQFEGYDEDRGRHIFSVNVPYDENRYAPIHVHEKDDLAKLAAKFTRTWRLHNKELRIKQLLAKMKSLLIESSL